MRGVWVWYGTQNNPKYDRHFQIYLPGADPKSYMARVFPWLVYEYIGSGIDQSGEATEYNMKVDLTDIAKSYLEVETYFSEGPGKSDAPEPPASDVDENQLDEDEYNEWAYRRALEKD